MLPGPASRVQISPRDFVLLLFNFFVVKFQFSFISECTRTIYVFYHHAFINILYNYSQFLMSYHNS